MTGRVIRVDIPFQTGSISLIEGGMEYSPVLPDSRNHAIIFIYYTTQVVKVKNAVIGSPPCAIWPHVALVIDQSDCSTPH